MFFFFLSLFSDYIKLYTFLKIIENKKYKI